MKNIVHTLLIAVTILIFSFNTFASGNEIHLDQANTNINDKKSLRRGAKLFMNYCSGCHSIQFMRYNRIGKDLNIADAEIEKHFILGNEKIGETITSAMSVTDANQWFGQSPDLSLVSRSKGVDWIYSYLHGFYKDNSRIFGVNNHILKNVSMPDVLWKLKQDKSSKKFDQDIRDITNFLDYVGEPAKLVRFNLGIKVLGFLLILFIFSYLLKIEYWKDIKYGKWRTKH
ncbi:cytochrome c1 [Candidatus Vesicomyidisocius calyptogenae]|uniref:Ubiquinol-cytochrome c reductase cytochrome c1 subunit n=1 Tax=Vesicomyosocius okutanii subsp. Calyptogena okutanii (strain HA) TaxID=412965 RepID=A5CY14_VESOH|nr:cytochrome c1 [Candidatus Vesicomyosocius okutanii]BAF61149.1 ubiquinol-cytochrome c reductase cytochrome c1 subunit [Candidatus Vesicomyosocius okutanii]